VNANQIVYDPLIAFFKINWSVWELCLWTIAGSVYGCFSM
jgi:hypothetical protein